MIKHLRTPVSSRISSALLLSALFVARPAAAQDEDKAEKAADEEKTSDDIGLGLTPGTPQVGTMPGGVQPSYCLLYTSPSPRDS